MRALPFAQIPSLEQGLQPFAPRSPDSSSSSSASPVIITIQQCAQSLGGGSSLLAKVGQGRLVKALLFGIGEAGFESRLCY